MWLRVCVCIAEIPLLYMSAKPQGKNAKNAGPFEYLPLIFMMQLIYCVFCMSTQLVL